MRVVRSPEKCGKTADIFLAGSILDYKKQDEARTLSFQDRTWREYIIENLSDINGLIFNPDRIYFPEIGSKEYFRQIDWEREYLRNSRLAVFWLSAKKPTSYASRVEIGFAIGLGIPIIIGIGKGFPGAEYLEAFLKTKPIQSLEELAEETKKRVVRIREG